MRRRVWRYGAGESGSSSPRRANQIAYRKAKGRTGGRPPNFDAAVCRDRNVVERALNRLKGWRGIATKYDKHARNYRAGVVIACIALSGPDDSSDRPDRDTMRT
ncbi:MAG: transposase [Propionibacteriales bacterium]|nr:transposase [Propionibacteriales bacterium]